MVASVWIVNSFCKSVTGRHMSGRKCPDTSPHPAAAALSRPHVDTEITWPGPSWSICILGAATLHFRCGHSILSSAIKYRYRFSPVCVLVCMCLSVCLLVTTASAAKTDEPIEMPFGIWSPVDPKKIGDPDLATGWDTFGRHTSACPYVVNILKFICKGQQRCVRWLHYCGNLFQSWARDHVNIL